MDKEVNYSGITRRIVAYTVDSILFFVMVMVVVLGVVGVVILFVTDVQVSDDSFIMEIILTLTVYSFDLMFNTLMLVKFGCTPGLFLFGMRVKDKNTLKKITVMQAIIRTVCFWAIYLICDMLMKHYGLFFILLPILILVLAVRDEHKQALHDKFANTVVIGCKPS